MKIPFIHRKEPEREFDRPEHTVFPDLKHAYISGLYQSARKGGDFYDVLQVPDTDRVIFLLLDIAGKREHALHIAADVQKVFRHHAAVDLAPPDINEADALTNLLFLVNRAIIDSVGGTHFSPAFIGCYNQQLGILCYVNAGHTPALVRDSSGVELLKANGLPLGLFSHATHDPQMAVLEPGAAVVLVSRGLVECKKKSEEYGIERAQASVEHADFDDADQLCAAVLSDAKKFLGSKPCENDLTTMALVRSTAVQAATSGM